MPLVHVSGVPNVETDNNRILTDIATPQYEREFFDYAQMTDGELFLQLKGAQFRLLKSSFPNHRDVKVWQKAESMYMNAIYKGVHGTSGGINAIGFLVPQLYEIQRDIKEAAKRYAPAGQSQILVGRDHVGIGTDPLIQWTDFKECDPLKNISMREYDSCVNRMISDTDLQWKQTFNEYLERSSHHLLYEFATDGQASQMRPTKNWKIGQHQQSISLMSEVSKLSRANIVEWHRLGIMRHNALKGAGALPPLQTIELIFSDQNATIDNILKNYKDPETGKMVTIGDPFTVSLIIFACVAAIVAMGGIIQIIKGKEPTAFDRLAGIGKVLFSAQGGDNIPFLGGGNNGNDTGGDTGGNDTGGGDNPIDPPLDPPTEDFLSKYKTPLLVGGGALIAYNLLK